MAKPVVVEDHELDHAIKVARVTGENGLRNAALLLVCFGTGLSVSEICRLKVSDYLNADGAGKEDVELSATTTFNFKPATIYWTNKRLISSLDAYLEYRLKHKQGVNAVQKSYRGLDPTSALFLNGRKGTGFKLTKYEKNGVTYESAQVLTALFRTLFRQAGIEGASAASGRRTLAVKLRRKGYDLRIINEILRHESLTATKRMAEADPVALGALVAKII